MRAELYVDTREVTTEEDGDLVIPLAAGVITLDDIRGDLFQLCRGEVEGRTDPSAITLFENGGGGHLDLMTADLLWRRASTPVTAEPPLPHVFSPLALRHRTLPSRITFGAHTANMAEGGRPGDRHLAYYRERALGGAAMIVVEPVPTHPTGRADPGQLPGRRRLAHPRLPPRHRGLPRGRRRDDDPAAVPRRPARRRRQLLRPELVAVGAALVPRRRRQPRHDRGRDRGAARRLRAGRRPGAAGRLRRRRAVRRVPRGHRPVLDAVVQPPHRRLGWLARAPRALLVHAAAAHPRGLRRRPRSSAWPSPWTRARPPRSAWRSCRRSWPGTTSAR